ncbi:V-type ATP synthase subunit K [Brevinematales bacterium NS]|nr:V-type ATP synthase subunit K [Brevinematales bacterium NS]
MVFVFLVCGVVFGLFLAGIRLGRSDREVKESRFLLQLISRGVTIFNVLIVVGFLATQPVYAQEQGSTTDTHLVAVEKTTPGYGMGLLAAAIAVAVGALGGGIAVGMAASAGMGALSENPKLFGNILIFVGLAEGIAIYGLVVALFILQKL